MLGSVIRVLDIILTQKGGIRNFLITSWDEAHSPFGMVDKH